MNIPQIQNPVSPFESFPQPQVQSRGLIEWNKLPQTRALKWHEDSKTRRLVSNIFLALSLTFTAAILALPFKAKALMLSPSTVCLVGLVLAALITALFISAMVLRFNESPLDETCRPQAPLKTEQEGKIPTYANLKRMTDPTNSSLLTSEEIQQLRYQDICKLNAADFIRKHGKNIVSQLDPINRYEFELKSIEYFTSQKMGLKHALNSEMGKSFSWSYEDLNNKLLPLFIDELNRMWKNEENTSYSDFIERNGHEAIPYITLDWWKEVLAIKLEQHLLGSTKGQGTVQVQKEFSEDFKHFDASVESNILKSVLQQSLPLESEVLDYASFRANNHFALLAETNPSIELMEQLAQAYLRMPYKLMKKFEADRNFLLITSSAIKNTLYLRWLNLSLQDVLRTDAEDFFVAIQDKIFEPHEWLEKVLNSTEGLSIREILALDPCLIASEILLPDTLLKSGEKLGTKLSSEVNKYQDFCHLVQDFPEEIFQEKWVLHVPAIHKLVYEFVNQYVQNVNFRSSVTVVSAVEIIHKYKLANPFGQAGLELVTLTEREGKIKELKKDLQMIHEMNLSNQAAHQNYLSNNGNVNQSFARPVQYYPAPTYPTQTVYTYYGNNNWATNPPNPF